MAGRKSLSVPRSIAAFGGASALIAVLAACASPAAVTSSSTAPAEAATAQSSTPAAVPSSAAPAVAASVATPAVAASVATPAVAASVAATPTPASATAGCASSPAAKEAGLPAGGSITVCPNAAPVGAVVHITIAGCAPDMPAAGLNFLGPNSWLGTNGGGGANVSYTPRTGFRATATYIIPATYTGGNENGPYPTLTTKPGSAYQFTTDPAGACSVPFTVLPS
jgi:hypothetical protein